MDMDDKVNVCIGLCLLILFVLCVMGAGRVMDVESSDFSMASFVLEQCFNETVVSAQMSYGDITIYKVNSTECGIKWSR